MKITVLNGSPKGNESVTMQYVKYMQKKFPEHEWMILNISQTIRKIENNEKYFEEIMDEINSSEAVLWAFPLYVFLVPSQYKRFIELITENNAEHIFKNKYTAVMTTSIHFFDHTAHNYMNAVCDDLDMKYLGSYSADMEDLFKEIQRQNLFNFTKNFVEDVDKGVETHKNYSTTQSTSFKYEHQNNPSENHDTKIELENKKIVIVTDIDSTDSNIFRMVERFKNSFKQQIDTYNLNQIQIKGGCIGCLQCAYENICIYHDKDEFTEFYNKIKGYDIIVFAATIKDRYLSSKWKQFFDRSFFNTHIPVLKNKQLAYIISGPLNQNPNIREILDGHSQWQHANVVDYVTDEEENSEKIDKQLQVLARNLIRSADQNYIRPTTFLGVGGMLLFRDAIYGRLRFPFKADHDYFKRNGLYNFPQNDYKTRIINQFMGVLIKIPSIRRDIYQNRIKEEMTKSFRKVLG